MTARATFAALGTTATVVVRDAEALPRARRLLACELARIDRACSRFRDDSELVRANTRAGTTVRISELFADAVALALGAAESTGGLVVPTLGRELRAAGYDTTFELVRARSGFALRPVRATPEAWREIRLDRDALELRVPRGVELDLGATAKAFAADRAAALIAAATGSGTLVSLGGDVAVAGEPPAGGFAVAIAEDHAGEPPVDAPVVGVAAGGLATSTTAVRSWPTDAGRAHHILDPRTGRPAATPWRVATVAASTCVEANVAATGAIVAGAEAPGWLESRGVHARLVAEDGRLSYVGRWPRAEAAA